MRAHALLLLLAACGSAPIDTSESSAQSTTQATIDFAKDWSVTTAGGLLPGTNARLRYDLARLPKCRATKYGLQAWSVVAYVSFDGRAPREIVLAPLNVNVATQGVVEVPIPLPVASDMSVWFHASDAFGCSEWDSRYGKNFHFAIQKPNAPVIHFDANWSTWVDGIVHAGEDVIVDYDWSRVPCRSTYNGYDAFGVTMYYAIDHGSVQSQDMTQVVTMYKKMPALGRITIPHGTHHLEVWFENNDSYGCHSWDSQYGANYVWNY